MATTSAPSSPKKLLQDQEPSGDKSESPILPPSFSEHQQLQTEYISLPNHGMMASGAQDKEAAPAQSNPQGNTLRTQVKTPEPRNSKERLGSQKTILTTERSPSTPGHLPPFDWDEFEARYEEALGDSNRHEQELLEEFDLLVKYFNVWASAASVHDTERGVKRLQTRERYVKIAEQSLSQKKKHLTEVVRAFQSALALLSQT
ncbi:hypothetical protein V8F33_002818 [Rhypophila sp. PSN 637]